MQCLQENLQLVGNKRLVCSIDITNRPITYIQFIFLLYYVIGHNDRIPTSIFQATIVNNKNLQLFFRATTTYKNWHRLRSGSILKAADNKIIAVLDKVIETFWTHVKYRDETKRQYSGIPYSGHPGGRTNQAWSKGGHQKTKRHQHIYQLIICIWNEERVSEAWKESIIIPIHKKRDELKCTNYRSIFLIDSA